MILRLIAIGVALVGYLTGAILWGEGPIYKVWTVGNARIFLAVGIVLYNFLRYFRIHRHRHHHRSSSSASSSAGQRASSSSSERESSSASAETTNSKLQTTDLNPTWLRARAMMHSAEPTMETDGLYLELLVQAVDEGSIEAAMKLADYAFKRGTNVEAYYWTYRAQKLGRNVKDDYRRIRAAWATAGCPDEIGNEYEFFTAEQGSLARALLDLELPGRQAEAVKYLKQIGEL